jgi:NTP pyrophosphatase (non-canonical NTP hydrolase)
MEYAELAKELKKLVSDRDWGQFHSHQNLAKSIAIEAGELLENFQWQDSPSVERVIDELADVLTYCYLLCMDLEVNPNDIIKSKLEITNKKYPISSARGSSKKYDQLDRGE